MLKVLLAGGGTALIITLGEIGILLNVSRQARVKKRK